jgi:hypothetical protein
VDAAVFRDPTVKPDEFLYDDYVKTLYSLNGGAEWKDIDAPSSYRFPECNTCNPGATCKLHLHGPSSWRDSSGGTACLTERLAASTVPPAIWPSSSSVPLQSPRPKIWIAGCQDRLSVSLAAHGQPQRGAFRCCCAKCRKEALCFL